MTDMPEIDYKRLNDIHLEILNVIVKNNLTMDAAYLVLGTTFIRYAAGTGKPLDQIMEDIRMAFERLPPPIEEKDEPNQ